MMVSVSPNIRWRLIPPDVVTSSVVHPLGEVVASSSGQHHFKSSSIDVLEPNESDFSMSDGNVTAENRLNIWSIQGKT